MKSANAKTMARQRLRPVLKRYAAEGTTMQCALRDLLTDIRHLADADELDFDHALAGSYEVYREERPEQRTA